MIKIFLLIFVSQFACAENIFDSLKVTDAITFPQPNICTSHQFTTSIDTHGNLSCSSLSPSDIPTLSYVSEVDTGTGLSGGPITSTGTISLADTLVTPGTYGDASNVGSFAVDSQGRLTSASSISIQIPESQVTNLVSDLAGKQPTGNYITALTGDVTASGPGSVSSTLATVNTNTGSFGDATHVGSFTVNGKGLITAASSTAITFPAAVTSVAMTVPSFLSVSGSPITSTGTLAVTLATESANTIFAGPTTGSAAAPTFRALVAADLPAAPYDTTYFKQNGNSFSADAVLGTNDNNKLQFKTNGSIGVTVDTSGQVGIGTASPASALDVHTGPITISANALPIVGTLPAGAGNVNMVLVDASSNLSLGDFSGYGAIKFFPGNSTQAMTMLSNDNVGIGQGTPTAILHLKAGTATAGTAPLKLASGTNLTTPEDGAMEYDGTKLWFTVGSTRNQIAPDAHVGTVTSVAMTVPGTVYSISGSPITSSGTLALSLLTQTANTVFSGPTTGSAVAPTFRSLVAADIPSLDAGKITTGQLALARGGTNVDLSATGGTSQVLKQNSSHVISVAQLAASDLSNGTTGTGAVALADSPTFTTKLTTPKLLGGSGTTQTLTYQTTSGVGATGADHIFLVGNAGATEAMRILNSGAVAIGTSSPFTGRVFDVNGQSGFRAQTVWSNGATTSGVIGPADIVASSGFSNQLAIASINELLFLSNGTNTPARMYIDKNGLVGIGTTSPGDLVDVSSTVAADGSTPTALRISGLLNSNLWTAGAAVANLDFYNNDSGGSAGAGVRTRLSTVTEDTLGNNWALTFLTSASNAAVTEKMRISSTGRVGVGVTSPTADLHLKAGTATASTAPLKFTSGTLLTAAEAGAAEYDGTSFYLTDGTPTRKGVIQNGGNSFGAAVNIGSNDNNVLTFETNGSEAARIDTSGFFVVGTTTAVAQIEAAGAVSDSSWTTNGKKLTISTNTLTDNSSTAGTTIGTRVAASVSRPTFAATNAITVTNAATVYIGGEPAAGTNVTITNPIALEVVRGVTYLNGNTGMGTAAPDSQLEVDGTLHLGTAGTIFTNMGTCTVASTAWTAAVITSKTCTGIPSASAYVSCSGTALIAGQTFNPIATGANTISVVASVAGTSALRCTFITP